MSDTANRRLIPDPLVARQRYNRNLRTLARWDDRPELGFPPPIKINGRNYRDAEALDAWDRANSLRAAEVRAA